MLCVIAGIGFLLSTYLFNEKLISPVIWMVLMGLLMYLPYLIFHTILFERWIAFFKYKGNLGYLMYMSDSLGYFGSMLVLLYKNYGTKGFNWLPFFTNTAWIIGVLITILGVLAIVYFRSKETPSKA
jgi:phosphoglycerol transferase MdoB-like AlkP superfamily enzyme